MRLLRLAPAFLACLLILGSLAARATSPLDRGEAVTVTSPVGGVRLSGLLRLPAGPGPFPAAVLLPEHNADGPSGTSANAQLLSTLADYLVSQGVAVLRLQERGRGGSGGLATAATLAERAADAIAALNYLRTRPQLDVTRLGLIGHGEGANVALLAGAQPLALTFVVALAAAGLPGRELLATQPAMYGKVLGPDTTDTQRPRESARALRAADQEAARMRANGSNAAQVQTYLDQQRLRQKMAVRRDEDARVKHQRAMLEIVRQTADNAQAQAILANMLRQRYPALAPTNVQASVQRLTTPAYRSFLAFDPQATLADVHCPVLLLQGDDDPEVNAAVNLALLKKGLPHNAQLTERRYPGANHALQLTTGPATGAAAFVPDAPADIFAWILSQK